MGEDRIDRRIRVTGPRAAALGAAVASLGWTVVDDDAAPVVLVDLAGGEGDAGAIRERAAVVGVSARTGVAAARDAYARGATHWLAADHAPEELGVVLDYAARYARRLAGAPPAGRRAADGAGDDAAPLRGWFAAHVDRAVSVVVVRLSRFEFVNAAFGRAAGDALIAAVEARIGAWSAALDADTKVHRDGAEFVIAVAAPAGALDAMLLALEQALAVPFAEGGGAVSLGIRVGGAEVAPGEPSARAIAAARRAIGAGRVADPEPRLDRLAADLHRALDTDEILVRFQPQATVATGAIVGVEALARWRHPALGELGAETLFAAAERAGLASALSDTVHARACEEAAAWPAALAQLRVSINVTAADLARSGFADGLLDRIAAAGLARGRVTIEIVETELVDDLDDAATILARLRGAGLRTAIDDFGTGYSSLAYLKALPIDYLKIDRSLTRDIAGSERDRAVVRGVLAIARSLGLGTIAEGVEREGERALLAAEGCDLYQGFLCAEALSSADLAALVARGHA